MLIASAKAEVMRSSRFVCHCITEGVKMRGTKNPADVKRQSSDQTVSIGIPYITLLCLQKPHMKLLISVIQLL